MAAISWNIEGIVNKAWKAPTGVLRPETAEVEAEFTVTDCNRQVTLEFGVYDKGDLEDRWHKINVFEDEVTRFIEKYKDALMWAEDNGLRDGS